MSADDQTVPDGWTATDDRLKRRFRFSGFPEALAFMVEVGLYCERKQHHPDWTNVYDRVSVELTTHDAGRVTEKDLALARNMNAVFGRSRLSAGEGAGHPG